MKTIRTVGGVVIGGVVIGAVAIAIGHVTGSVVLPAIATLVMASMMVSR